MRLSKRECLAEGTRIRHGLRHEEDRQCTSNITLGRVLATTAAVEEQ